MTYSRQQHNFPLPGGEVTAVTPNDSVITEGDSAPLSGGIDSGYIHGGPHASAFGGAFGYERSNADVTTATPRKKPDYGPC